MYHFSRSTFECSTLFVSRRTHKALMSKYSLHCEGMSVWWHTSSNHKFIGTIVNGLLVKA